MKRDFDLIRAILLYLESQPRGFIGDQIALEGNSNDEVVYHLVLMKDEGLIEGLVRSIYRQYTPIVRVHRMTRAGHDFLDACRDEGRWNQAKEIFNKMGGVTFNVANEVLVRLMMAGVSQILPNIPIH
ncbi:MAG: DUF2513 domain-containing protein [Methanomicrobiales archaeon]|nr:DUF2513 domain-containing protein [Methanomicrobiales archaeon]